MSRDQQMRNIRDVMKKLKESQKIEYKLPKKKRKIMQGLALRNGHLEPIAEEDEEFMEKSEEDSREGEKRETLADEDSVVSEDGSEDISEEESKPPEKRTLPEIKGKQKEITG
ncbi:1564_t:CDS:1 [Dentiscutata heterogama]|uniref:1564_t:CDS:1 n=1 Tax=Dentiscutata heterogama TaxID=1316150 RepID=A0ACA9P852_9GLOM|nr:1564_t:CDS:1 [Dentiscutata heterogama]